MMESSARRVVMASAAIALIGAIANAISPGWVMTGGGLFAFAAWNVLVMAMAAMAIPAMRARLRSSGE